MKRTLVLVALAVGLLAGSPAAQASGTTYRPGMYEVGPQYSPAEGASAHRTNYIEANPNTGKVTVLWANATPGAIGCPAVGGFSYLRITKQITTETLDRVLLAYQDATISQYAWVKVNVFEVFEGTRTSIASTALRGQLLNARSTFVLPVDRSPVPGSTLLVDFGIETASACPNADGGTVTFTTVTLV